MSALSFPSLGGPDEPHQRLRGSQPEITWGEIALRAPLMVSTMAKYLAQLSVSARPGRSPPSRSPCASLPVG